MQAPVVSPYQMMGGYRLQPRPPVRSLFPPLFNNNNFSAEHTHLTHQRNDSVLFRRLSHTDFYLVHPDLNRQASIKYPSAYIPPTFITNAGLPVSHSWAWHHVRREKSRSSVKRLGRQTLRAFHVWQSNSSRVIGLGNGICEAIVCSTLKEERLGIHQKKSLDHPLSTTSTSPSYNRSTTLYQ